MKHVHIYKRAMFIT